MPRKPKAAENKPVVLLGEDKGLAADTYVAAVQDATMKALRANVPVHVIYGVLRKMEVWTDLHLLYHTPGRAGETSQRERREQE